MTQRCYHLLIRQLQHIQYIRELSNLNSYPIELKGIKSIYFGNCKVRIVFQGTKIRGSILVWGDLVLQMEKFHFSGINGVPSQSFTVRTLFSALRRSFGETLHRQIGSEIEAKQINAFPYLLLWDISLIICQPLRGNKISFIE